MNKCDALLRALHAIVGDTGVVATDEEMAAYSTGARYGVGRALCVVRPNDTEQVSKVVKLCVQQRVQIVPQGANTGLVGASTPDDSATQVVLSLSRMRTRRDADIGNRTVNVDAGVLLHEVNDLLEPHGLWFPVDLGADPSIGGMVAANTGGTRLIRYGDVRRNLLALEVVLFDPPGEVVRIGRPLRKDNTGFDLKQLFTGTSGAVGVITNATLEVHPRPKQTATALVVPSSDEAVGSLLLDLEGELGDFLSAFEGMSRTAMQAAIDHVPALRNPFGSEPLPDFAVLIELESCVSTQATGLDLQRALGDFLEARVGDQVANALIGKSGELWQLRHAISEGARALGQPIAFDISVPRSRVMEFRREALSLLARRHPYLLVVDFGHIADGGMHFNLAWPADAALSYDVDVVGQVRDEVYDLVVADFEGSFSAEHGVGPHNIAYWRRYTPPTAQRLASRLQALMNPGRHCGVVDFSASSRST